MKLARQILSMSILILMVAWFVAGMLIFPDAPIKLCEANAPYFYSNHPYGYCGKQGQSHTAIDFHNFNMAKWLVIDLAVGDFIHFASQRG